MNPENKRLSFALAVSVFVHLMLLWANTNRQIGAPIQGVDVLLVRLAPASLAAQSSTTRPDIDVLPDFYATPFHAAKVRVPSPQAGVKGNKGTPGVPSQRTDFNDSPSYVGQYPDLPLPAEDFTLPYLPPALPWEISPHYPDSAFARKIKGYVRLELLIDEIGAVLSARVVESNPPGVFDEAAWQAFHTVRFQPAYEYGWPVPAKVSVKVIFDPEDRRKPRPPPTALKQE